MNTDPKSIFDYIFGLTLPGVKLELSRVEQFMAYLGNPYMDYPVIHIAGTNGKGSTAAMLASILTAYGLNTGLFTSPHLIKPNERIKAGGISVPDAFIIKQVDSWRSRIDQLGITFFEVLTALGFVYFKEKAVDYAVIETGLGGRLDATNVVDPVVGVITSISMDHENILGHSLEQITAEKAGIIKSNRPLILGENSSTVRKIIEAGCSSKNAEYNYVPDHAHIEQVINEGMSQRVKVLINHQLLEISLPLLGLHQVENFCNVLLVLNKIGFELDQEKIQRGLNNLHWQGRLQTLQTSPLVLYDVAHNHEGLVRLEEALGEAGLVDTILIAAFNARKDVGAMLDVLKRWEGFVLFTMFEGHSAVGRDELILQGVDPALIMSSPSEAYIHALDLLAGDDQAICFFGSHYLAADLFELFDVNS